MRLYFTLLFSLFFVSCAVYTTQYYEEYLKSLIGISETELITLQGIPTKIYETDKAKFLTYYKEFSNYTVSDSYSNTDLYKNIITNNVYLGTDTSTIQTHHKTYCETMFTIINDKVVKYSYNGNKCGEYIYKGEAVGNF